MARRLYDKMFCVTLLAAACFYSAGARAESVYLEEMTSPEIASRLAAGNVVAIIPTGGTEQNGPHMVTGKHNSIVRFTAGEIARKLGNAMVAPVISYVPEGRIEPPEGHMNFAGTISVREETYEALLEDAASSLKQHGFKLICFIGDSGGNQLGQQNVADRLSAAWQSSGVRVINVSDYYNRNGQDQWVESMKIMVQNPNGHAGFEDTSELMAVNGFGVRNNLRGAYTQNDYRTKGTMSDSSQASADHGRHLLGLKIDAAIAQINEAFSR